MIFAEVTSDKVVALVGSSRFKDEFHRVGFELEKRGITVLMMACFQHADGLEMDPEEFRLVHSTNPKRIDLADEVIVLDVGRCTRCGGSPYQHPDGMGGVCHGHTSVPYVGEDTRREIEYATRVGKKIRYLSEEKACP